MDPYDEETERYLREFRPRAIHPLEVAPKPRNIVPWRLATTAALALWAGGLLWFGHRESVRPKEAVNLQPSKANVRGVQKYESTLALTRLALTDNEKLESLLAEESRKVLPAFQGEQSTLKVLAKE